MQNEVWGSAEILPIYPMRKGAANSKRMCIICHYLIAQNGHACTSFFDTLVGSVSM